MSTIILTPFSHIAGPSIKRRKFLWIARIVFIITILLVLEPTALLMSLGGITPTARAFVNNVQNYDTSQDIGDTAQKVKSVPIPKVSTDIVTDQQQKGYSNAAVLLSVLILILLGILFNLLLNWSRRRDMAGYYGKVYEETVANWEFRRLLAPFTDKLHNSEYHTDFERKNPAPEPGKELAELATQLGISLEERISSQRGYSGDGFSNDPWFKREATPAPIEVKDSGEWEQKRNRFNELKNMWSDSIRIWEKKIDSLAYDEYKKDKKEQEQKAKELAKSATGDVDLSVFQGRSGEFVLEFTAVVVIIFSSIILGILGILKEQQIGTLLAAIAGYVLGKASSRTAKSRTSNVGGSPPGGSPQK